MSEPFRKFQGIVINRTTTRVEENSCTVLEQALAGYFRADSASRASLAVHLLDLQGQISALDNHISILTEAAKSASEPGATRH